MKVLSSGPWYQIRAEGEAPSAAEVLVYGDIGESWYGDSVTAKQFVEALQGLDVQALTVRINSYGGSVSDGIAIYNAIRRHPAQTTVAIDGVAVSIASLIAMAGDTITMAENALMMIHAPWSGAVGNAKQFREYADVLDTYAKAMATSYADQTGKGVEEILALLTDGADHWYTAHEAAEAGFVDEVGPALAAAASLKRFQPPASHARHVSLPAAPVSDPAATAATQATKEAPMSDTDKNPAPAGGGQPVNADEIRAQALADDQKRRDGIKAAFGPFAQRAGIAELMAACQNDTHCSVEAANAKLLAKLGEGVEPATPAGAGPRVEAGADERDSRILGMTNALLVRANAQGVKVTAEGNPYRGHTLLDLARMSLEKNGVDCRGWDKRRLVGAAFNPMAYGLQTTSDFPVLLESIVHKVLLGGYTSQPDTWSRFCKIGEVSDFRAHNRYRVGSIGNLDSLNEHGEFTRKTIPDGEKGSVTATTKGNIIGITREAIINDDLQALTSLAAMLGRAYRRTIEAAVYSLLAENSGLGPTMSDAKTLFHADHGNLIATGSGGAPSVAEFEAMRVKMATQTDVGGNDYLDLRPALWLGPVGLGGDARVVNDAQYDPDTANKLQKPNKVRGLFRDIVDTPRLSGTAHYMFADANEAPVIEVAFLDGIQEPYIEAKDGWSTDGAELKVRGDFGVAAIDYRGAVLDQGA